MVSNHIPCPDCGDTGFVVVERGGVSGAERCRCSVRPKSRRPNAQEIGRVIAQLAECIPFFPKSEDAWLIVTAEVSSFVADLEGLREFARVIIRHCKKYEGPAGLRQIYCAYRMPADGIYPDQDLPGFSTAELHARHEQAAMRYQSERLETFRQLAAGAPAADRTPFQLPAVKTLESYSAPQLQGGAGRSIIQSPSADQQETTVLPK